MSLTALLLPFSKHAKQHEQMELKKRKRGRPSKKKIMYMDGKCCNFKSSAAWSAYSQS